MKNVILEVAVAMALLTGLFYLAMTIGYNECKKEQEPSNTGMQVLMWNDDEESIPVDGTKVVIEFTKNDTIYIGPAN